MDGIRKRKKDEPRLIAPWVLTFGDMMTQILCFFIILFSVSDIKKEKLISALKSVQHAFNITETFPREDMFSKEKGFKAALRELTLIFKKGASTHNASPIRWIEGGKETKVESIREGLKITIGGKASFAKHSAELSKTMKEKLKALAETLAGYPYRIEIRGHASRDPFGSIEIEKFGRDDQKTWKPGKWNLSYQRALNAARHMASGEGGIARERIRISACGDVDPLKMKFTENMNFENILGKNRRVEIVVTEEKVEREERLK